jgi:hypothetical protein
MSENDPANAPPPTDDFVPGVPKRVGRFEVRRVLGNGTFGRVLLGYDPVVRREVAIKQPFGAGLTPEVLAGFLKEAWATAEIHHANVCPIYEAGTEGGLPYLVMKYVRGGSLADVLKRVGGPVPARQACAIAQKLALGLGAAHAKKVVHRDLKTANALYDEEAREVLLADFGLVQFADQAASGVRGTAAYMSPEHWSPNRPWPVEARSDLYSLGVILFELLTGRLPFGGSAYELMVEHCQAAPPVPSALCPGLDPRLDALTLRAMAKTPADRFPSAQAFATALGDYLRATGDSAEGLAVLESVGSLPSPRGAPAPALLPSTAGPEAEQLCCPNCQAGVTVARGRSELVACAVCKARFSAAAGRDAALRLATARHRPPPVRTPLPSGATLFVSRGEWLPATRALRLATVGLSASVALLVVNAVIILGFERQALEEMPYRAVWIGAGVALCVGLILLAVGRGRAAKLPPGVRGRAVARTSSAAAWLAVPCAGAYFAAPGTPHAAVAVAVLMLCLLASEFAFNRYLGAIGPHFGPHFPHSFVRIAKTYLLVALGSAAAGVAVATGWGPAHGQKFARAVLVLLAGLSGCLGFVCVPICFITSVWLSASATLAAGRHLRAEG